MRMPGTDNRPPLRIADGDHRVDGAHEYMGVQVEVHSGTEAKHWRGLGPCPYPALLCHGMTLMGLDPY
jgi:hypothetical protein